MKKYVEVALPINTDRTFTYSCYNETSLIQGQRVLVSFNYRLQTGIIIDLPEKPNCELSKLKDIIEIIDDEPIMNHELLSFAQWISNYYFCPIGLVLKAMLPSGINVNTFQKIILKKDKHETEKKNVIIEYLKQHGDEATLAELRGKNFLSLFKQLIEFENEGIIEIERRYKNKIQKKTVNFIRVINPPDEAALTPKQKELFLNLDNQKQPILMANIAKQFSYNLIKRLEKKRFIEIYKKEIHPDIFSDITKKKPEYFDLSEEQYTVLQSIETQMDKNSFKTFLLHGVTASGKTEVYIRAMRKALNDNKAAILLIPEISLTPQTVERFYSHFGDTIAVLHSKLSDRERLHYWNELRKGKKKIVIGPRSALFAPLSDIGIIIVDEEHENTYKQHERPPLYNARDMAVLRGKLNDAVVILGSATPVLETYYNTQNDKYSLLTMSRRVKDRIHPKLTVVDMRQEDDHTQILSKILRNKIEERLNRKEQILLFQNRRGFASYVQCAKCGHVLQCKDCNISLTYHSYNKKVVCHYCGREHLLPRKCPECNGYIFHFGSPGTEKIEKNLEFLFPTARIARMDTDTTSRKNSYRDVFDQFRNGYIDILLGTQMIIKGLDFPNITLVGIISADVNLNLPDFRASERNFQHIIQVAGRAGRSQKEGEVIVQTFNPKHYSIQYACQQDFDGFIEHEFALRNQLHYPPFYKLARILFSLNNENRLRVEMENLKQKLMKYPLRKQLYILGPTPSPLTKVRKQFRYHVVIKSKETKQIQHFWNWFNDNVPIPRYIKTQIDIDPVSLL